MSALPELPVIPLLRTGQVQIRDFTIEEVQKYATEYGELCRKQALEQAAKVCDFNVEHTAPRYGVAIQLIQHCAKVIRSLK